MELLTSCILLQKKLSFDILCSPVHLELGRISKNLTETVLCPKRSTWNRVINVTKVVNGISPIYLRQTPLRSSRREEFSVE